MTEAKTANKKLKSQGMSIKKSMAIFAWAVLALPIVKFLIFYLGVNINTFALAFKDTASGRFTLGNFKYVFGEISATDSELLTALKNTFMFFVLGIVMMIPNIILSCILYKKIWGYKVFQILFFMPSIIGAMVWMSAYKNFVNPDGPLIKILMRLKLFSEAPELLANSDYAIWTVMGSSVWLGLASGMLIYLGTLARIPKDVLEAQRLDGVNFWQEIYYILLPLIWPAVSTNLIFAFIGFFNASGNILLLTQGRYATTTFSYWFYERVVLHNSYNIPSALGILMTVAALPIALIGHKLANRVEAVEF